MCDGCDRLSSSMEGHLRGVAVLRRGYAPGRVTDSMGMPERCARVRRRPHFGAWWPSSGASCASRNAASPRTSASRKEPSSTTPQYGSKPSSSSLSQSRLPYSADSTCAHVPVPVSTCAHVAWDPGQPSAPAAAEHMLTCVGLASFWPGLGVSKSLGPKLHLSRTSKQHTWPLTRDSHQAYQHNLKIRFTHKLARL